MGEMTTSEGQSYALLRAAFMDDQDTFAKAWSWTKQNLQRSDGQLFAWKWGKKCDGTLGVLSELTASDADEDIALALIVAGSRWHRTELLHEAVRLLGQIWQLDVIETDKGAYMGPGDWAKHMEQPMLNPSYFAPYAYRLFAAIDQKHNWSSIIETSYDVLDQTSDQSRLGLPPDWCELSAKTGKVSLFVNSNKSDYSMDAIRVPWRICLDWNWNQDARARAYLSRLSFLQDSWSQTRTIYNAYSPAGVLRNRDDSLAGFCCILPLFAMFTPEMAEQVLQERVLSQYYGGLWNPSTDYYSQNWAWFGIALMHNKLQCPSVNLRT
jgi:endoglucanase